VDIVHPVRSPFFFSLARVVTDFEYSRNHNDPASRETVRKAYELALNHIAQDKDNGDIWSDHIHFLKAAEVGDLSSILLSEDGNRYDFQCSNTWEEQQKMDASRKAYYRAVQIPLDNAERLWQELEAFEIGLNNITVCPYTC
jgi:cleavage stimulation factor subunit 3